MLNKQSSECVNFGKQYSSEKVALSFKVFAGYRHQILNKGFQVSERLH